MKVLYDSHVFDHCRYGGIAQYYVKLWDNFANEVTPQLSILESENVHLRECGFEFPLPQRTYREFLPHICFKGKLRLYNFLGRYFPHIFYNSEERNERNFRHLVKGGDYDLVHLTGIHGHEWLFKQCAKARKPIVVTCFDLIPELYDRNKAIFRENSYAYSAATCIIAISENTKRDLCNFYKVPSQKVHVIHLGCDVHLHKASIVSGSNFPVNGIRYVLYVGKRSGYKNFEFFVRAIAPVLKADKTLKVYCTGTSFSTRECDLLEQLGVRLNFMQQFVSDRQLPQLYRNSLAFVYPSLHEGFGLPILDAFASGCPTLLANATCFPEVGGDAALYFDPKDEDDFRRQLMRVIGDDDQARGLRADMVARGKERVKLFSWKKCAEETAEVYRQCVSGRV